MLEIDEQPVEAGGLHRLGDVDRARLPQADAEKRRTEAQAAKLEQQAAAAEGTASSIDPEGK